MVNITINSDKTISINGKKTFPLMMYHLCQTKFSDTDCLSYLQNNIYDINLIGASSAGMDAGFIQNHEWSGKMFTRGSLYSSDPAIVNSSAFFGWYQPDEPKVGSYGCTDVTTEDECIQKLINIYNTKKTENPNHMIIMSLWKDAEKWKNAGDIVVFGLYPFRDNWMDWWGGREYSLYGYEYMVKSSILIGTDDFDTSTRPLYPIIQALSSVDSSGTQPLTFSEMRGLVYQAITFNSKGLAFYTFSGEVDSGLYHNDTMVAQYNKVATELKSFNDFLVLPTKDYSWHYRQGTRVSFSKTLTHELWAHDNNYTPQYLVFTATNFNYILKLDNNTYYLIVVNKDTRPISDVELTISGLTGTMPVKTLGLETSGSGRAGRVFAANNGQFTDSFDGYAVHIYQISSDIPCPASECDFTITQ